jgi:hypothetical protein
VALLLEAFDILGVIKTDNWTQATALNEVYLKLSEASEAFVAVSPSDLAVPIRERINKGLQ